MLKLRCHHRTHGRCRCSDPGAAQARAGNRAGPRHRGRTGTGQLSSLLSGFVPVLNLGLSSHSPAPEPLVLIAVPPAIDRPLYQPSLSSQATIQLCKSPADGVAFCLIVQSVSFVALLSTASPRINTVLVLKFGAEGIHID